jgi:hypothetical protein
MSDDIEEMRRQRDALAWVVWQSHQFANCLWDVEPIHVHEWMLQAGLIEEGEATAEDCDTWNGLEPGEIVMRLTPLGKDALTAAAERLSHG